MVQVLPAYVSPLAQSLGQVAQSAQNAFGPLLQNRLDRQMKISEMQAMTPQLEQQFGPQVAQAFGSGVGLYPGGDALLQQVAPFAKYGMYKQMFPGLFGGGGTGQSQPSQTQGLSSPSVGGGTLSGGVGSQFPAGGGVSVNTIDPNSSDFRQLMMYDPAMAKNLLDTQLIGQKYSLEQRGIQKGQSDAMNSLVSSTVDNLDSRSKMALQNPITDSIVRKDVLSEAEKGLQGDALTNFARTRSQQLGNLSGQIDSVLTTKSSTGMPDEKQTADLRRAIQSAGINLNNPDHMDFVYDKVRNRGYLAHQVLSGMQPIPEDIRNDLRELTDAKVLVKQQAAPWDPNIKLNYSSKVLNKKGLDDLANYVALSSEDPFLLRAEMEKLGVKSRQATEIMRDAAKLNPEKFSNINYTYMQDLFKDNSKLNQEGGWVKSVLDWLSDTTRQLGPG